jgi:hypothetical protein
VTVTELRKRTHRNPGKTIFLYYLLVCRLLEQQPTAFQYNSEFIVLFDQDGVSFWHRNSKLPSTYSSKIWALVDSNQDVITPAPTLRRKSVFLVIAASPRSARWTDVGKISPYALWFMNPFTLTELIQA